MSAKAKSQKMTHAYNKTMNTPNVPFYKRIRNSHPDLTKGQLRGMRATMLMYPEINSRRPEVKKVETIRRKPEPKWRPNTTKELHDGPPKAA